MERVCESKRSHIIRRKSKMGNIDSKNAFKIIDEIEAFQKIKRLRPSRANFVELF